MGSVSFSQGETPPSGGSTQVVNFFRASFQGGINTSMRDGGIYVKSIVPGGPAAKEGQILHGEGGVAAGALGWRPWTAAGRGGRRGDSLRSCPASSLKPQVECLS